MPKYFEFVFAAYGIWIAGFAIYFIHLLRKSGRITRALADLKSSGQASDSA